MNRAFVDSGYWLALELAKDQNHELAVRHWQKLCKRLPRLVTTSYVFDETVTFLNSRGFHERAVAVGNRLLHSPSLDFVHVNETLFSEAWRLFEQRADKGYSFTDCVSFVVLKQSGIERVLTFDRHFTQEKFTKEP